MGYILQHDARVQAAVAYYREVFATTSHYTAEKLVKQWADMASLNVTEFLQDDWTLKPLHELTEDQRTRLGIALIGLQVTERRGKVTATAQLGRVEALKELAKLLRVYTADHEPDASGMHVNITIGQSATIDEQEGTTIGHLTIRTQQPSP